jgi:hypothetical protein
MRPKLKQAETTAMLGDQVVQHYREKTESSQRDIKREAVKKAAATTRNGREDEGKGWELESVVAE